MTELLLADTWDRDVRHLHPWHAWHLDVWHFYVWHPHFGLPDLDAEHRQVQAEPLGAIPVGSGGRAPSRLGDGHDPS
ncbi:hypothetical protein ACIHFD_50160 [Nonomuraea sp. NPDC051941]|uniref:hypothetical protein n=1 Tax=Nonomuraea sp. NPDC051941 TaxID=3364373 RepID=UPI0037CCB21C